MRRRLRGIQRCFRGGSAMSEVSHSTVLNRIVTVSNSPSAVALGRFLSMGFSLLTAPLIARSLGPEGRGYVAGMLSFIAVAPVAIGLGIPLAVRRQVLVGLNRRATASSARTLALLGAIPSCALALGLNQAFFANQPATDQLAFVMAVAATPLSVSWAIDVSLLLADRAWRRMAVLSILQIAFFALVIIVGWLAQAVSIGWVIWANLVSNVVAALVGCMMTQEWRLGVSGIRRLFSEGLSLVGAQIADIASRRLDQALALPLIGAAGTGIYSVAVSMGTLTLPVSQAISAGALAAMVAGGRPVAAVVVRQAVGVSLVLSALLVPILAVAIPLLFGEEFFDAVPVAVVVLAGSHFANVGYVCVTACMAARLGVRMTAVQVVSMAVGFGMIWILGPVLGAMGVAVGMGIGFMTGFFMYLQVLDLPSSCAVAGFKDTRAGLRLLAGGGHA